MRKLIFSLTILLLVTASVVMLLNHNVYAAKMTQKQLSFIDEFGDPISHTTLTSVTIQDAGTSTTASIYSDRNGDTAMTNPIVTGLAEDRITFWSKDADYKCIATDGTYTRTVDNLTGSQTRFAFPTYLVAMSSRTASDSQTYVWGTGSDVTSQWINASDIFRWTPSADGIAFDIGVSGTTANWDFNVYTGTAVGLKINEGASTCIIDGLTTSINTNSNYATNINTGTSTGAITIGSSTSGAWAIDGTSTGTINADDSIGITVSAGTIDIDSTGGDLGLDATNKSILIDAGEAAADAITITATGTAGGIDITSLGDIDITTTGAAGEDITLDNQGGSIHLISTEAVDDGFNLDTTGGVDIDATTSISLKSAEATGDAIEIVTSNAAGGIDITSGTGDVVITSTDDIQLTNATAAGDMIQLLNTAGTSVTEDSAAIQLTATAGGIQIQSDGDLDDAVVIRADGGTTAEITVHNDQGTATDSIELLSDAGGITLNAAKPVVITNAFEPDIVIVPDGAAYDVLANNSGQIHIIQGQTADITLDLPTEADGLHYKFVYVGGAEDAQDWIIDTENNTNFFYGGLMTIDDDDHSTLVVFSDESDDSIITVLTPSAGTFVEMWCDGTNWYVTGIVISGTDTAVTFTNL